MGGGVREGESSLHVVLTRTSLPPSPQRNKNFQQVEGIPSFLFFFKIGERHTKRQTDRQTERERQKERDRTKRQTELKTETETQTERASNKHTQTEKKYGTSTCCARFSLKTTPRPIPHTHIPCTAPVSSHLKSFVCSNSHMSSSVSDLTNLSPLARSLRVLRKSCDLPLTSTKLTLDGN